MEAWDAEGLAPFPLWLGVMSGAMTAVDDAPLPNGTLHGTPAWVLRSPTGEQATGSFSAFLDREGRYYRITFFDGAGTGAEDFRRVLASLRWQTGSGSSQVPSLVERSGPDP
jgi:hypothetical protein